MKTVRNIIENEYLNYNKAFSYMFCNHVIMPFCVLSSDFEDRYSNVNDLFFDNAYTKIFDNINQLLVYDDLLFYQSL